MTNRKKREILSRYRVLDLRIKQVINELADTCEKISMLAPEYSKSRNSKNQSTNPLLKLENLKVKLENKLDRWITTRGMIEDSIESMNDETYQCLLELKYIKGLSFERTAEEMYYSYQWICVLHGRALKELILIDI